MLFLIIEEVALTLEYLGIGSTETLQTSAAFILCNWFNSCYNDSIINTKSSKLSIVILSNWLVLFLLAYKFCPIGRSIDVKFNF